MASRALNWFSNAAKEEERESLPCWGKCHQRWKTKEEDEERRVWPLSRRYAALSVSWWWWRLAPAERDSGWLFCFFGHPANINNDGPTLVCVETFTWPAMSRAPVVCVFIIDTNVREREREKTDKRKTFQCCGRVFTPSLWQRPTAGSTQPDRLFTSACYHVDRRQRIFIRMKSTKKKRGWWIISDDGISIETGLTALLFFFKFPSFYFGCVEFIRCPGNRE